YMTNPSVVDQLVTVMPATMRNQKLAGFTAIGGSKEVAEGHPYEETGFEDKYVTTKETKNGRIVSLTAELLLFDQTGEVNRRAAMVGEAVWEDRERSMMRQLIDADSATNP